MKKFEHLGFQEKLMLQKEFELENQQDNNKLATVDNKTYPDYMIEYDKLKATQIKRSTNQAKVSEFNVILKALPRFAEANDYDIVVESSNDGLNATIKITTDFIMGDTSNEVAVESTKFLNNLFFTYPNYVISAKDDVMTFTFSIHLYDEEDTGKNNDELENIGKIMRNILAEDNKTI